jgi:PAS domain S-box-containing protein
VAAAVGGLAGLVVLAGWALAIPVLRTGLGIGDTVNPAAAMLQLLAAGALWLSGSDPAVRWRSRLGLVLAVALLLIGALILFAPQLGLPAGFDQIPFRSWLAALGSGAPKPLSGGTALLFLMMGAALLLARARRDAWRLVGRSTGLFVALIGLLALIVYVYRWASGTGLSASSNGLASLLGYCALGLGLTGAGRPAPGSDAEAAETEALRSRVRLAFVVAVVILILTGTLAIGSAVRSATANRQRDESAARERGLWALFSTLQLAQSGTQSFAISGDRAILEPSRAALDSLPDALRRTGELLSHSVAQARRFDTLQPLVREAHAFLTAALNLEQAGRAPEALAGIRSGRDRATMDQVRRRLSAMVAAEHAMTGQLEERVLREARISLSINAIAALLAVCFLTLAGFAINRDFRKRARAEEALRENERRLSQIVDLLPSMVFLKEPEALRFVQLNKAGEELLGYSRETLLGKTASEVFPEEEARRYDEQDRAVLASSEILDIPEELTETRTSGPRVIHTKKVAVRDPSGRPLFLLGIGEDITERKRAEAALEAAKEAAERANLAKSDFLAKMSHELRTPLNSIIGFSEILEDESVGPLTDKQRRYISNVLVSGRNLLQLINDILDLSKVEAGRMELVPSRFEVPPALEQVRAIVAALADRKHLTVDLDAPASLPLLHADQAKFKQIMYNLLGNAIKFTPDGGRVTVSARVIHPTGNGTAGECLEVAVADTGIGIAAEHLGRIFGEFEQVNADPTHGQEGTGLGLALTSKLVELHGGRISVESELGRGSTFRFSLPLAPPPVRAAEAAHSPPDAGADPARPLVLVIDNDRDARALIAHYLTEAGYRVECAADGGEAIRLAEALRPDAITLDILLPDRDGLLILAELKSSPETRDIPVVVVSVTDRHELGFSLGAAGWLVKPVHKAELLAALAAAGGGPRAGRTTVLVVDDEPATVAYLSELLQQRGFGVLTASGGEAGIGLALTRQPDLILLDLMMPGVNGFDVVQALRANPLARQIPILILTGMDLTRADTARLGSSVQAILGKGGPDQLLAELARICPVPAPDPVAGEAP